MQRTISVLGGLACLLIFQSAVQAQGLAPDTATQTPTVRMPDASPPSPTSAPLSPNFVPATPPAAGLRGGGVRPEEKLGLLPGPQPEGEVGVLVILSQEDLATKSLVDKWKATQDKSERGKIEEELRKVATAQFAERLAQQAKEVEQLEAKVQQLRKQLDLRRQKEKEIVDFRIEQLLREAQGLGWSTDASLPQGVRSTMSPVLGGGTTYPRPAAGPQPTPKPSGSGRRSAADQQGGGRYPDR